MLDIDARAESLQCSPKVILTCGKALELPKGNDNRDWSPAASQLDRRATLHLVDDTRQAIASLGN